MESMVGSSGNLLGPPSEKRGAAYRDEDERAALCALCAKAAGRLYRDRAQPARRGTKRRQLEDDGRTNTLCAGCARAARCARSSLIQNITPGS